MITETQVGVVPKVEAVRTLFEKPDWYFSRRAYDVWIRTETVRDMVNLPDGARVLDIGSGDGSISLPLLRKNTQVTLLDLSSTMLSLAQSKVPAELQNNVEFINDDFMNVAFEPQSFDVILCIGLLVHVESPAALIAKMANLLKPNGRIIVECSDASHFASRFFTYLYRAKGLFRSGRYRLNAVSYSDVLKMLGSFGFSPEQNYRYSTPFPGVNRFFSQHSLYRINRGMFGRSGSNRNAWLGNEHITLFSRRG